jgi:hypothetical protein
VRDVENMLGTLIPSDKSQNARSGYVPVVVKKIGIPVVLFETAAVHFEDPTLNAIDAHFPRSQPHDRAESLMSRMDGRHLSVPISCPENPQRGERYGPVRIWHRGEWRYEAWVEYKAIDKKNAKPRKRQFGQAKLNHGEQLDI